MADRDFNNDIIPTNVDPKIISILAYLSLLGWVVALVLNSSAKSELASFHLRQGLGITLLSMIAGYVSMVPFVGHLSSSAGWVLTVILWILGILGALQGEKRQVPFLGESFQEWFRAL